MRPTSLDEVAGQSHLLRPGSPLVLLARPDVSTGAAASVILWGPPGTGKTTLAQAIARSSGRRFVELSAVTAGVKDVREVLQEALTQRDLYGQSTILFLDEIHRFTKAQQDALLPGVENGWVVLIAATTENPSFSVISPLLSRSLLLTLQPLTDDDLGMLLDRAVSDPRGLGGSVTLLPEARDALVRLASGDARRALTALEAAASLAEPVAGRRRDDSDDGEPPTHPRSRPTTSRAPWTAPCCAMTAKATSTTTSSARSSSRSAAPTSTRRCTTSPGWSKRGGPALHRAPSGHLGLRRHRPRRPSGAPDRGGRGRRRRSSSGCRRAASRSPRRPPTSRRRRSRTPPISRSTRRSPTSAPAASGAFRSHLRDAHYPGAKRLGHGKGYRYPHDSEVGVVAQQYLPDELAEALLRADQPRSGARRAGPAGEDPPHPRLQAPDRAPRSPTC